jgi:hypothetical protein
VHKYQAYLQAGRSITGITAESTIIPTIFTKPDAHGIAPDSHICSCTAKMYTNTNGESRIVSGQEALF